jgi:hypothetical protein
VFAQLTQRVASTPHVRVVHGMQEVSGSSPLSSTCSDVKFERFEQRVQQQSTATAAGWAAVCVFGSGMFPRLGLLADSGFQALNRR